MISMKDLRELFDDATKRAGNALDDAKMPNLGYMPSIGRKDPTPGLLYFGLGLLFGSLLGLVVAFLATPYSGEQARQKVSERVEKARKSREEASTNGSSPHAMPTPVHEPS